MDGETKRYLDIVFKNCKNDTHVFLAAIVDYLPTEFVESNGEHDLSEIFSNALKERQNQLIKSKTTIQPPDVHENTSCDMFDDDDEIVPETQEVETQIESEDSGESVLIPFYDKKNTCDSECSSKRDSDNESEYMQVRPESNVMEPVAAEPQSQFLMANMDRNLIRDLGLSTLTQKVNGDNASSDDDDDSTLIDGELAKELDQQNENSEKQCDNSRSGSTTPDLDFGQGSDTEPAVVDPVEQTNDKNGENHENSDAFFEKCTQQFCVRKDTSTEDIFAIPTQPISLFKHPAPACSTPIAKSKSKPLVNEDENIFDAETQLDEDIFEKETQISPDEIQSSARKSTVNQREASHASRLDEQEEHEKSDDIFEKETQPIVISKQAEPLPESPADGTENDIFDVATQMMPQPSPARDKRISLVATQSQCEPVNTPPWSAFACLPNAAIEQLEKEKQAERETAKQRIKKRRYLFSSTSDEDNADDDDGSDLEFDLGQPAERIARLPAIKENTPDESIEENHSKQNASKRNNFQSPPMKKQKSNDENVENMAQKQQQQQQQPAKRTTRQVSVKVSREEVERHMRSHSAKAMPKKNTKPTETKADKSNHSKSIREKNSTDAKEDTTDVRKSKRTKKPVTNESPSTPPPPPPSKSSSGQKKKSQKDEKANVDTPITTRNKRSAKKGKANGDDVESANVEQPLILATMNHHNLAADTFASKRRHSDRHSARKSHSARLCILFTKVNPAPYTKIIENLGGSIVDTPQFGHVLICDSVSRTFKFLYCLAKGLPIVTPTWLSKSSERGYFQPTDSYLIVDHNAEKRFNFNLKISLETAQRKRLFANYHIFATPNVQPTTDEICEIVECSGGKYGGDIASIKRKPNTKIVLITHKKDKKLWPSYRSRHPDIQIVSSEGFMQSVVQQEINFSQYELAG